MTRQLCSTLIFILVTGCGTGAGAELKSCTERLGGEILFVGEARCLATLPQEELSGYWVSGHEYSVFYAAKQDIKREPDARAAWLFLSRAAEGTVKEKLRAGEWQVFAIRFVGAKSTARGIYGPGPFEAGVLVARIIEIEEISDRQHGLSPQGECYEPFVGGDTFLGSYAARFGNLGAHLLDSVSGGVDAGLAISGSVSFFGIKPSFGGGLFSMGASTTLAGNASISVKTPTPGNLTYGEVSIATGPVKWGAASSNVTEGISTRTGPFSNTQDGFLGSAKASAWKSDFGKLGAHLQIGIGAKVEVDLANAGRAIGCAMTNRR